jgi:hypothetical protein
VHIFDAVEPSTQMEVRKALEENIPFRDLNSKFVVQNVGKRPPLWSTDQSSWLQIQRSGFDSRQYQIFRAVVGLERSRLSLVGTTEELLERKSSGSGLESREYGRETPSR